MKKKYCIGFFVVLFVFVSLLGIGYQVSYQYVMDRQMARRRFSPLSSGGMSK